MLVDEEWLNSVNEDRKKLQLDRIDQELFEIMMDRLEKEWFDLVRLYHVFLGTRLTLYVDFQTKNLQKPDLAMPSEDSTCAICDDSEGENSNAIVFCDGCNLAVHQGKFMVYYHFTKVEHAARLLWCALHPRGSMALSEMYGFP